MVANCFLGKEDTDFHPASPLWVPESPALMTIPPSIDWVGPSAMHDKTIFHMTRPFSKDLATASTLWEQNHLNYSWSQNTLMSESIKWCSLSNKRWCVPKATYRACKHWLCICFTLRPTTRTDQEPESRPCTGWSAARKERGSRMRQKQQAWSLGGKYRRSWMSWRRSRNSGGTLQNSLEAGAAQIPEVPEAGLYHYPYYKKTMLEGSLCWDLLARTSSLHVVAGAMPLLPHTHITWQL